MSHYHEHYCTEKQKLMFLIIIYNDQFIMMIDLKNINDHIIIGKVHIWLQLAFSIQIAYNLL